LVRTMLAKTGRERGMHGLPPHECPDQNHPGRRGKRAQCAIKNGNATGVLHERSNAVLHAPDVFAKNADLDSTDFANILLFASFPTPSCICILR
jgi:hypothetical protein